MAHISYIRNKHIYMYTMVVEVEYSPDWRQEQHAAEKSWQRRVRPKATRLRTRAMLILRPLPAP